MSDYPYFTKQDLIQRFAQLLEHRYNAEDSRIDRSNCVDSSWYEEERNENQAAYDKDLQMLEDLKKEFGV